MTPLRTILAGTVALTAAVGLAPTPALAGPAVSAWSHQVDLDPDSCIARARKLMAGDGWTNIQSGRGDLIMADKGRLSGMVACLSDDLSENEATAAVVIAGGGDGEAAAAADQLHAQLVGS